MKKHINAAEFEQMLMALVALAIEDSDVSEAVDSETGMEGAADLMINVRSYAEVGMLTSDHGVVVLLSDGTEFRITIQEAHR